MMRKSTKFLGILSAAILAASVIPFGASAESDTLNIVPITDPSQWKAQNGDNSFGSLDDPGAWINADIDDNGAVTLSRTNHSDEFHTWPLIRSGSNESPISIDLSANPYLYYDIEATANWNIHLTTTDDIICLAKGIVDNTPGCGELDDQYMDGTAGNYTGKINLAEYITEYFPFVSGLQDQILTFIYTDLYIVDNTPDGLSGRVTYNKLVIGSDDLDVTTTSSTTAASTTIDTTTTTSTTNTTSTVITTDITTAADTTTTADTATTDTVASLDTNTTTAANNPKTGYPEVTGLICVAAGASALAAVSFVLQKKKQ